MNKVLSTLFLVLSLVGADLYADTDEEYQNVRIDTCYDAILWTGVGYPKIFDSLKLTTNERELALKEGLAKMEEQAMDGGEISQQLLAQYYFTSQKNPNPGKAVYWARKCANQGSAVGMNILRLSYANGSGVVQDHVEAIKWLFLAASRGCEDSKKIVKDLKESSRVNEGRRRAVLWAEEHEDVLISP